MEHAHKNFLERLQSADDGTKRRWMFASVTIVMVIVVYVWLAYFNNLVTGFNAPTPTASAGGFSFVGSLGSGVDMFSKTFFDGLPAFGRMLAAPREYIISPGK